MISEIPPVTVGEVMHRGLIATAPQTPVLEVAETMARNKVHCLVSRVWRATRHSRSTSSGGSSPISI